MNKSAISKWIKQEAIEMGFLSCGIAKADFLEKEAVHLENWLNQNYQGKMSYMENHFDKRVDPRKLVDGAKSVISVLLNYYPEQDLFKEAPLKIAKYAYGDDYHNVIRKKLNQLIDLIKERVGEVNARCFTDSAPVLDKAWAERAGLGWIGKNANLISTQKGSFFFIGEIIIDLDLEYDEPATDHCGTCTACIDACPTGAIIKPQLVDGSKCISYLTIELKDELIPKEFEGKMDNWVFGCDICQDVCPWNRFSKPHKFDEFNPHPELSNTDLDKLNKETFNLLFKHSAIKRTKYEGLVRNVRFVKNEQ
ncbi:tRNA epoxyqueuosine(34) reductase QueG [Paracrocinitomix mangrovi]|uniref:tRNA epoxyqueuosine(34) reductase QueG n=1 Tax=Paracrocinitomix mangrovi TaxID=2862509 RepID=UPI001C8CF9ED|nr:tRNA epoxyqueuosine(34) reductase QueG [Paracrocinitomix mangrovi]UKN00879.1 tRNA epoxyqueuosine(34) reductase QueG [Paracrocinitomix mangrovi]